MHEVGIAESAVRAALVELERHGARRVRAMGLRIGKLAAVDGEALRFAFAAITPGTALEGIELSIEAVEPMAWCAACEKPFTAEGGLILKCPECGDYSGDLRSGREIELARLELE